MELTLVLKESDRLVRMAGTLVPVRMQPFSHSAVWTRVLYTRLPAWMSGKSSTSAWPAAGRRAAPLWAAATGSMAMRSEEHTSELQSRFDLVCRLLLEKKKMKYTG